MSDKRKPHITLLKDLVDELKQLSQKPEEVTNSSTEEEHSQAEEPTSLPMQLNQGAREESDSNDKKEKSLTEELDSPPTTPSQEEEEGINTSQGGEGSKTQEQASPSKESKIIAIVKTWLFFANSIMSGEFLAYQDYSRTLDSIIEIIRDLYSKSAEGDPVNDSPYLHPILAVIHDLCFELRTRCMLMRIQIKVEKEKESVLAISTPLPHQWSSTNNEDEELKRLADWVRQLVEGLIEMTEIDFTCHTSEERIKSLHALFDACEQTKNVTVLRGETTRHPFIETPHPEITPLPNALYGMDLLQAIRCKCSLLAYQSIFKVKHKDGINVFDPSPSEKLVWNKYQYEETPYKAIEKAQFIVNGDRHSALDISKEGNSLFGFWKINLHYYRYGQLPFDKMKHIAPYDMYIKASRDRREKFSPIRTQLQKLMTNTLKKETSTIQELDKIICQHLTEDGTLADLPFDLLLACMRVIERAEVESENYEDNHTRVKLLGDLLLYFHENKTKYKHTNQAYEQTRRFEESFFTCTSSNTSPFFIASLGCKYINPEWLDKCDTHYNRLLRKYRIQESEALFSTSRKSMQENEKLNNDLRSDQERNRIALKDQQRDYLTLLGIFAALITLSVSLVESFKLAETIWDYMVMLGGAYVLIGLLVIVLYLTNKDDQKPSNKRARELMALSMLIAAVLGGYGVGVKSGGINLKVEGEGSPKSEERTTSETRGNSNAISPTTIVNQMQLELPKNTHSTHPRQSKKSKGMKKQDSIPPC